MGGKSQPAPDYTQLAAATERGVAAAERISNRQLDFAQTQYNEMKPLYERIVAGQEAVQQAGLKQGQEYYDYMKSTFRPIEQGLVSDVTNFNTEGYRQQLAQKASADAAQAFQSVQGQTMRDMARRGINPSSGAALAMANSNAMGLAAMQASGMNNARRQAEATGYARKLDVAGLGRNLPGASTAAYGLSTNAGSAAGATAAMPGNQYMTGMAQGGATSQAGYGLGVQGYGNILNNQTNAFNTGLNAQGEMFGAALGAGAMLYRSDRRLKEDIQLVGRDERTMLPLYEFKYKGGKKTYLGVMADDVEEKFPEAVFTMPDGFKAVNYAALGIEMIEV